jgi:hypothetical protein
MHARALDGRMRPAGSLHDEVLCGRVGHFQSTYHEMLWKALMTFSGGWWHTGHMHIQFLSFQNPQSFRSLATTQTISEWVIPTFSSPFGNATEVCMAIQGYAFASIKIPPFGRHLYITAALYSVDKKKRIH